MTTRWPRLLLGAALWLSGVTPAAAQPCSILRVDQESYSAVSELVYIYVPNVNKSDSFTARVLVGQYRRPLLLKQGFMKEADINQLLAENRDVRQYPLQIAARSSRATQPLPSVSFKDDGQTITIRVKQVVLATAFSSGGDHVLLEVCPPTAIREGLSAWRRYATTRPEEFGKRWRSSLMAESDYGIEAVQAGECQVSFASSDGPTASCAVAVEKSARESGDLNLEWRYRDHYTQVIRFKGAMWMPEAPSANLDEKRKREEYQQQIRQALTRWMTELKSGVTSRMRRAAPALEAETRSPTKVSGAFCLVAVSALPSKALCRIATYGTGPIPKGVDPQFYKLNDQASIAQELVIEQTPRGSPVANPVTTTRR